MKIVVLIVLAAVLLVVIKWVFLPWFPYRRLLQHRTRHMRTRVHLHLHPGPGHATVAELWLRWGRLACFRRSRRARWSMSFGQRVLAGPRHYSIVIGRAHFRHALRIPLEEHAVVTSPPRGGKTGWLSSVILHYPGPVISTTTKHDVFELTSGVRARHGPVHVFNPQGVGNVPSTFRWNPIEGCQNPATAIRRADAFATSVTQKGVEDATFWASKASDYLRAYFHAAALANLDLRHVARWVTGGRSTEAEHILNQLAAPGHQWAAQLAELRGEANKTAQTIRMTMSRALAFLADPALAAAVLPTHGQSLDFQEFLWGTGTLYLIAESRGEDAPVAPLFACLASELHYTAALLGSRTPGGRLDPPLLMALDEVTQICPVPLPSWLADSGGKGIQIITVAHGEAQLRERWGPNGARIIMDTSGTKIWLPGISDTATLEAAATLCGTTAVREHGQDHHTRHPVLTPEMIRQLPAGYALVVRGGHAPVIVKLPMGWKDRTYRTYRNAGHTGTAVAQLSAAADLGALPPTSSPTWPTAALDPDFADLTPEDVIRGQGDSTPYPWDEEPS